MMAGNALCPNNHGVNGNGSISGEAYRRYIDTVRPAPLGFEQMHGNPLVDTRTGGARAGDGGPAEGFDMRRLGRVIRRFKWLVIGGVVLAAIAAVMAVRASGKSGTYSSQSTMFISTPGFSWGMATDRYIPGNGATNTPAQQATDLNWLTSLTALYAQLATTDSVHSLLRASDRSGGQVSVNAIAGPVYTNPPILPLLRFWATTSSPQGAVALVNHADAAFQTWLKTRQDQADIPPQQRVLAQVVSPGSAAVTSSHQSKSLPIMIFVAIVSASIGLALILDNARPEPTPRKRQWPVGKLGRRGRLPRVEEFDATDQWPGETDGSPTRPATFVDAGT